MRFVLLPALFALVLLVPASALAETVGAPVHASPSVHASPPGVAEAEPRAPRSRALALTIEILSPLGGPGSFYARRYVRGSLVVAGSLLSGGMMLYALRHGDRDAAIVNAVAYGAMRGIGIASAAAPIASAAAPTASARTLGLWHRFSF